MSRAGTMGQAQKVSRLEAPGAQHEAKLGKQGPHPQGILPSPSTALVTWFRPHDLHIAGHAVQTLH